MEEMKQNDKARSTHLGWIRVSFANAQSKQSCFSLLVFPLNGGRTFWDMGPYVHANVTMLCDKDEGNNGDSKRNNTLILRAATRSRQLQCVCESTGCSTHVACSFLLTQQDKHSFQLTNE